MSSNLTFLSRLVKFDLNTVITITILYISNAITIVMIIIVRIALSIYGEYTTIIRYICPIVVGIIVYLITIDIIAAGHIPVFLVVSRTGTIRNGDGCDTTGGSCRTCLIIVVDYIDITTTGTSITSVTTVIDNTVTEINYFCLYLVFPLVLVI